MSSMIQMNKMITIMSSMIQMNKMIKTPIYFTVISECPLGWHFLLPLFDWGRIDLSKISVKCYSISWTSSNSCEISLDLSDTALQHFSECFMHLALVQLSAIDDQYVTIKYPSGIHCHIQNLMSSCSADKSDVTITAFDTCLASVPSAWK